MESDNTKADENGDRSPFDRPRSGTDSDLRDREYGIYQCNGCENVVLSMQDCEGGITCHGEPMERVTECNIDVEPPDIRQVLLDAFGLPKPGLDICLCVIGDGPVSADDVAETLDYDRSTVTSYLNDLVGIGLLEKSQLNREDGGVVNVYHSIDLDRMRRETLVGFYVWAGEAVSLINDANLTKADYAAGENEESLQEVFWESFDDGA